MTDSDEDSNASENQWPMDEPWLLDLLRGDDKSDAKVKINHFSAKTLSQHGISNLSDLITASITYEIGDSNVEKQLDIVIKLLPHDPFSRYFVTINQFDYREIQFYTKIYDDLLKFQNRNLKNGCEPLTMDVPKNYFTSYKSGQFDTPSDESPEPPESILVLQDMRTLGYTSANLSDGLNLIEAESAIKSIASFHALVLGMKYKEKVDLNEKYPFLFQTEKATDSYQQLVEQGFPQLVKFLRRHDGYENEIVALEQIRPKTKSIIEKLLQPIEPIALITHTDFWCNNLLLRHKSDEEVDGNSNSEINCSILDWQMITYSRPTNDLALLILSSLSSSVRREHTQKLLTLYFTTMKQNLEKVNVDIVVNLGYSAEKLIEDYKKSQLLALLLCIGSADIALGNEHAEERFLDALRDLYKEGVLNVEDLSF